MTLARELAQRITRSGPLRLDHFMAEVLRHSHYGYYRKQQPLGHTGDFVTAPEISPLFGEMIGLWCVDTWERMGSPKSFNLAELGPGRGTLMADALRVIGRVRPSCLRALTVHLVEIGETLRAVQKETLKDHAVLWHETVNSLPESPLILLANEFFDALPVRHLRRVAGGWSEIFVGHSLEQGFYMITDEKPCAAGMLVPEDLRTAPEGCLVEVSPESWMIMQTVSRLLKENRGATLIIDYGHAEHRLGATLQAVRNHQKVSVFETPGECDLTAHVDFAALKTVAEENGLQVMGPVGQGGFLKELGIEMRLSQVVRTNPPQAENLTQGVQRLIDPEQMGSLFQVMAVVSPDISNVSGFSSTQQ